MARLQALKQQHFLETSNSPITSTQVEGGFSEGVPKMHPLKSNSMPILKATKLLRTAGMRIKKPRIPGLKLRMPKL